MTTAIEAKELGKRYYLTKGLGSALGKKVNRLFGGRQQTREEFWALRGVNFSISPGEAVGLIGPNGAGKSTILKLLSGVTRQTTGTIGITGKVGALIEVGAGFHPELSGRENIYLNGSILGMKRAEIKEKYDDIVTFSELEQFIDTPVKRYSSGMFVRLGFAVAINTDPDILLVDEVLAVGDFSFRKKCLDKILSFRRQGKTFFLVSHDMVNIENVCDRVIYMNHGVVQVDGTPAQAIAKYYDDMSQRGNGGGMLAANTEQKTGDVDILDVKLNDTQNNELTVIPQYSDLVVTIEYDARRRIRRPKFQIAIRREMQRISVTNTHRDANGPGEISGRATVRCVLKRVPLVPSHYYIDLVVSDGESGADLCLVRRAQEFSIEAPRAWRVGSTDLGVVQLETKWTDGTGHELR